MASSRLITDSFPKTKKDRPINQKLLKEKTEDLNRRGKGSSGFFLIPLLCYLVGESSDQLNLLFQWAKIEWFTVISFHALFVPRIMSHFDPHLD